MYTLGFVGAGHMGSALLDGLLKKNAVRASEILAYDPDPQVVSKLKVRGISVAEDEAQVVSGSRTVFLCARPCDMPALMAKLHDAVTPRNVLISIAAGMPIAALKKALGKECKLIRAIPSIPVAWGEGFTAMAYAMPITYPELQSAKDLFSCVGDLRVVEESKLNDYIAAASSSSAYLYYMIKAIADGAVAQGIDADTAMLVAEKTLAGAAATLKNSGKTIPELLEEVATPNGTTAAALAALEKGGFAQTVSDAMLACTKRAAVMDAESEA